MSPEAPKKQVWDQQPSESAPAFAAFAAYRDTQSSESLKRSRRSLRATAKQLGKSSTIVARWSKRHSWGKRVLAYDDHLDQVMLRGREAGLEKYSRRVMTSQEVLVGMTRLAESSITDVLTEGRLDLGKAIESGADKFIKAIHYHNDGSVRSVVMYDAKGARELMGRYFKLWDRGVVGVSFEDDEELARRVLAGLAGIQPGMLPPANPLDVDGELVLDSDTKVELEKEQ